MPTANERLRYVTLKIKQANAREAGRLHTCAGGWNSGHRKEIIRMELVVSIAIALLPGAHVADGPPQVKAVASSTLVDSTGKAVVQGT